MKKVLIVEDELVIAMINQKLIENIGFSVIDSVTTGEEALEVCAQETPDLILMDIMIEGDLDGIETINRIRQNQPIPVIFITGNSDKNVRTKAENVENSAFLVKPINQQLLENSIQQIQFP